MLKRIHKKISSFRTQEKISPSGKYLVEHMLKKISFEKDINLLQLGFGTGVFTIKICKELSKKSTLTIFEIDTQCKKFLPVDTRITYIEDSAENIEKYYPKGHFDYILSTLPFASLPQDITKNILNCLPIYLKKGGKFLQFQYFPFHKKEIERVFQRRSKISFVLRNIPSAFVYELDTSRKI